ncbi:MAG: hypothetical protein ABIP61_03440 [Burkholderiaceae bacterium]
MPLFSKTHTKRRTVHMVLLVWLFAMTAGWANACLLDERGTQWHGPSVVGSPTALVFHALPSQAGVDVGHFENAGPDKSACLKVCGDDSQPVVKLASGVALTDVAMAPPVALIWPTPVAALERNSAWLASPARSPGVPLRTCLARLAL